MKLAERKSIIADIFLATAIVLLLVSLLSADQISVERIEMMPNMPAPYEMRDWKQVAIGYDDLVFDFDQNGLYLPLIFWRTNTVNYPEHISFGLHTVVGTPHPHIGEGINVLPAVVGASLAGLDKSDQNGENWVLMCEEWFNNRPQENVYLNHPVSSSGHDWWYDTMPNIFFYQLYDLYPGTGDFDYQFTTLADRWLQATATMGGSATPWQRAYMNYRGWYLETMTPNDNGVPEPEAAGAIGWLLYNAFTVSGDEEYRFGAEWAMEYLDQRNGNPSYELQLPYGVYMAARMNAELGTGYDLDKMVNWCFDVGPLRQWGAIVGNWGGYDCHGLIGEALGNGHYAFIMNGFEQAGALLPMVRYDDRYARAIGKWALNVANASRLFYTDYLPDENQDSEEWAHEYDPNSYIAHEAMRDTWNGFSPYATGDAISGGWGETNLALYGSSHVGIFGGIIDTTNVEMILCLDVLKTDYFHDQAYPTYLYYNPYDIEQTVEIDVGSGQHDLYDAAANSYLQTGITGATSFSIPPDTAVLLVITPAGGQVTYNLDKMLIDEVIVDYLSGQAVDNYPPRIKSLAAESVAIIVGQTTTIYCTAADLDEDELSYTWTVEAGTISGSGSEVTWTAPDSEGMYVISCLVEDGQGGQATADLDMEAVESINHPPVIVSLTARPRKIDLGATSEITCTADDPDQDELSYSWSAEVGVIDGSGETVTWTAPDVEGDFEVNCQVDDGNDGQDSAIIGLRVRDLSNIQTGEMVAFYPFNGNANDESGYENHGTVSGAALVDDRFGQANSAFYFDGNNDKITIPNDPSLNFQESITVNFWINIATLYDREAHPVSHGSWENRWKVSITNERARWTIKTDHNVNSGIKDLDSETTLTTDVYYNLTAYYDGSDFEIYLDGELDSFSNWSGSILTTNIDFMIGQVLPGNSSYNFKGVIDDLRIYNYALPLAEIEALYYEYNSVDDPVIDNLPDRYFLAQNHPNPFHLSTAIYFELPQAADISLLIYNAAGRLVRRLAADQNRPVGNFTLVWDGRNNFGNQVGSGIYFYRLETVDFTKTKKMVLLR